MLEDNIMAFERFTQRGGRARYGFPVVTLQASVSLSFNDLAFAQIGRPSHVILSYDRETRRIGFERSSGEESYSFAVRSSGGTEQNKNWSISVRSFYAFFDIDRQVTRRFRTIEERGMIAI